MAHKTPVERLKRWLMHSVRLTPKEGKSPKYSSIRGNIFTTNTQTQLETCTQHCWHVCLTMTTLCTEWSVPHYGIMETWINCEPHANKHTCATSKYMYAYPYYFLFHPSFCLLLVEASPVSLAKGLRKRVRGGCQIRIRVGLLIRWKTSHVPCFWMERHTLTCLFTLSSWHTSTELQNLYYLKPSKKNVSRNVRLSDQYSQLGLWIWIKS